MINYNYYCLHNLNTVEILQCYSCSCICRAFLDPAVTDKHKNYVPVTSGLNSPPPSLKEMTSPQTTLRDDSKTHATRMLTSKDIDDLTSTPLVCAYMYTQLVYSYMYLVFPTQI